MTWFRVDDQLHSHPKAMRAGPEALGLWVLAGSWAGAQLTDGWVPDYVALRLAGPAAEGHAERLVRAGLWVEDEQDGERGWWFHEWTDHQPSRDHVLGEREKARQRMAEGRARRRAERDEAVTSGNASGDVRPNFGPGSPSPTRPDPTRPVLPSEVAGGAGGDTSTTPAPAPEDAGSASRKRSATSTRGARLPDDWWPDEAALEWFRRECPTLARTSGAGSRTTETFRDYWHAETGAKATKRDWTKAWQVWLRREEGRAVQAAQRSSRGPGGRPNDDDRVRDFAARTALPDHGHAADYDEPFPLPGSPEGATVHQLPRSEAR